MRVRVLLVNILVLVFNKPNNHIFFLLLVSVVISYSVVVPGLLRKPEDRDNYCGPDVETKVDHDCGYVKEDNRGKVNSEMTERD